MLTRNVHPENTKMVLESEIFKIKVTIEKLVKHIQVSKKNKPTK